MAVPQPYNKIGDGPEGPEVRVVAEHLFRVIGGKVLNRVTKTDTAKIIGSENISCPCVIENVWSRGKKILISMNNGHTMIISLGMTGRFQYAHEKHVNTTFECLLSEGIVLVHFSDSRRMGSINVVTSNKLHIYFLSSGPDLLEAALAEWISPEVWLQQFTRRSYANKTITDALKEQKIVSGIGNYLRAEILYVAKVAPHRLVKTITLEEWETLRTAAHIIIKQSYDAGGCTIQSFITPDGTRGGYQCLVYGRQLDSVGNEVTTYKRLKGDQTTYYVPAVQE
jgi:DNA-formamidopyrimidine glycosylase